MIGSLEGLGGSLKPSFVGFFLKMKYLRKSDTRKMIGNRKVASLRDSRKAINGVPYS